MASLHLSECPHIPGRQRPESHFIAIRHITAGPLRSVLSEKPPVKKIPVDVHMGGQDDAEKFGAGIGADDAGPVEGHEHVA